MWRERPNLSREATQHDKSPTPQQGAGMTSSSHGSSLCPPIPPADVELVDYARRAHAESDTVRILSPAAHASGCWAWMRCLAPAQRIPVALGPGSPQWVVGERVEKCPICEVEFGIGTQHKHVTRRHCRKCGGVFCYLCTYDKATLRTGPGNACMPCSDSKAAVHVCSSCYDQCPPPPDGLRRCRICHQRVRSAYFDAHYSVCLEGQYSRTPVRPSPSSVASSSSMAASSSSAVAEGVAGEESMRVAQEQPAQAETSDVELVEVRAIPSPPPLTLSSAWRP